MNIFCREKHIYNNFEVMTSLCHVCQVRVIHIIVQNLLSYMSTNFYRTQPTFGDAMTKMQGLGFLDHSEFLGFLIIHDSWGSVVTYVRYGGMSTQRCIANFLLSLSVKEFLKSVKIWQSYCESSGAWFFGTWCSISSCLYSLFGVGYIKSHLSLQHCTLHK